MQRRRRSALVEHRVVVGERFGEPREARGGDLLERCLVTLVADAAHVEDHAVLEVAHLPAALLGPRAARKGRSPLYSTSTISASGADQLSRTPTSTLSRISLIV